MIVLTLPRKRNSLLFPLDTGAGLPIPVIFKLHATVNDTISGLRL
jgi:hypothetical protein